MRKVFALRPELSHTNILFFGFFSNSLIPQTLIPVFALPPGPFPSPSPAPCSATIATDGEARPAGSHGSRAPGRSTIQ